MKQKLLFFLAALLCMMGTSVWALEEVDGVYQINTGEDLVAFSELVNNGTPDANAVLTADIDMAACSEQFMPIGSNDYMYAGTFDGQGHKISNLKISLTVDCVGLFGVVQTPAIIRNLVLTESCHLETTGLYGGIVAILSGADGDVYLENLGMEGEVVLGGKNGGGILGNNKDNASVPHLKNCYMTGTVSAGSNSALMVGYAGKGTYVNCWGTGTVVAGLGGEDNYLIRSLGSGVMTNCFSKNGSQSGVTIIEDGWLESGELCFRLNGEQKEITWYQTIGSDNMPVLDATHGIVYTTAPLRCDGLVLGAGDYTNDPSKASKTPDHQYENGVCTVCGMKQDGFMQPDEEGFYNISKASELAWFASAVNIGEGKINGRLTADIDMAEYSSIFTPIGDDGHLYSGVFDGQGHVISNLNLDMTRDRVGLFGGVQTPAVIKNFVLDSSCSLKTTGAYCAVIGSAMGNTGDVYIENVGMEGDVTLGGKNGAGIIGNSMDDKGYLHLKNCYMTGNVSAGSNSALITGYAGPNGSFENCWGSGEVLSGLGGQDVYLIRGIGGGTTTSNCYSKFGEQSNVTIIEDGWLESGELCYLLNGKTFVNPGFYQNIGDDMHPVLNASHGIVYKTGDYYSAVTDDASFNAFQGLFISDEKDYCDNLIAEQNLIDQYVESLAALEACQNMQEFMDKYFEIQPQKEQLNASSRAYAAYQAKVDDIKTYLNEHDDFGGAKRDYLESYLDDFIEPEEDYPNGSASYITETHMMSEAEIQAETEKIAQLLDEAISEGFSIHAEVTNMLTNADFSKGYEGWEGQAGTGSNSPVAECKNATCDYYQTITDLRNGVYELQVSGFFLPGNPSNSAGNLTSTNYGAFFYTNEIQNYLMAGIEDMVTPENAVHGENCIIEEGASYLDKIVYNEDGEVMGYIPSGQTGFKVAANAGRYQNRVLVNVTDGTLTVGFRMPGTGVANDCMEIGNIKLFYHGTLEEADAQIDNTLACMAARAQTLVETEGSSLTDYAEYPNFSNELREALAQAVGAVGTTSGVEEKYALIKQFSDLFQQVYESKKVFVNVMNAAESLANLTYVLTPVIDKEYIDKITAYAEDIVLAYVNGTATEDMANLDNLDLGFAFAPKLVDGVYQIENGLELAVFSSYVQGGQRNANAILTADIDMTEYSSAFVPIGSDASKYTGTFDGQGHRISNLNISLSQEYVGLFGVVETPATIRNLVLDATCRLEATGNYCGLVAAIKGTKGDVYLENLGMEGAIVLGGKNGGGILGNNQDNAAYPRLKNCYMTGTVSANTNSALLVGYAGDGGSYENCWGSGEVLSGLGGQGDYLIRSASNSTIANCYSKFGTQSTVTTIQDGQLESGELCYLLNGDQSEISWYQNVGEDQHPVLDPSHGIVVKNDDGTYSTVTGIKTVIASESKAQSEVYDLQGRRVANDRLSKGIYVVKGKKILVK